MVRQHSHKLTTVGESTANISPAFNVAAVATFFGLAIAVFIAINRGMGVHVEVVLFERGLKGLSDYNQVI